MLRSHKANQNNDNMVVTSHMDERSTQGLSGEASLLVEAESDTISSNMVQARSSQEISRQKKAFTLLCKAFSVWWLDCASSDTSQPSDGMQVDDNFYDWLGEGGLIKESTQGQAEVFHMGDCVAQAWGSVAIACADAAAGMQDRDSLRKPTAGVSEGKSEIEEVGPTDAAHGVGDPAVGTLLSHSSFGHCDQADLGADKEGFKKGSAFGLCSHIGSRDTNTMTGEEEEDASTAQEAHDAEAAVQDEADNPTAQEDDDEAAVKDEEVREGETQRSTRSTIGEYHPCSTDVDEPVAPSIALQADEGQCDREEATMEAEQSQIVAEQTATVHATESKEGGELPQEGLKKGHNSCCHHDSGEEEILMQSFKAKCDLFLFTELYRSDASCDGCEGLCLACNTYCQPCALKDPAEVRFEGGAAVSSSIFALFRHADLPMIGDYRCSGCITKTTGEFGLVHRGTEGFPNVICACQRVKPAGSKQRRGPPRPKKGKR